MVRGFFIGQVESMIILEPLYRISGEMDDLAFYRGIVLWAYGRAWGVIPRPYVNGTVNPVLCKWWEASLN